MASMPQLAHTLVWLVQPHTMAPAVLLLVNKGYHSQPQQVAMVQALVARVATMPGLVVLPVAVVTVALPQHA